MNQRNRKNKNSSGYIGFVVIALMALLNAASGIAFDDVFVFVAIAAALAIAGFVLAMLLAKKKGMTAKNNAFYAERAKEKAKHVFMREEFNEETVKCSHPRGKEKYLRQLDNFLASGLIDKNEYRILKARYEKLNIPENMH